MSLQENKLNEKLVSIVLCAGKGKRIKSIVFQIPKPLIKVDNKPLLSYLISNLIHADINSIYIITGHKREKIEDYICSLIENDTSLQNRVITINSGNDYKKGPLYSFLSITKNTEIIKKGGIYLIFPGDTYFESELLESIFKSLHDYLFTIEENPIVFYQKMTGQQLKSSQDPNRLISTLEFREETPYIRVKQIWQKKISTITNQETINQLIPLFVFSTSFINKIVNNERKLSAKTIWEIVNYLLQGDSTLSAYPINAQFRFYDIDTEFDLIRLKEKKREKDNR
ncbi:MAG: sugar phosphate nucleotidyltransferase [Promethearchaeota archaeon]